MNEFVINNYFNNLISQLDVYERRNKSFTMTTTVKVRYVSNVRNRHSKEKHKIKNTYIITLPTHYFRYSPIGYLTTPPLHHQIWLTSTYDLTYIRLQELTPLYIRLKDGNCNVWYTFDTAHTEKSKLYTKLCITYPVACRCTDNVCMKNVCLVCVFSSGSSYLQC